MGELSTVWCITRRRYGFTLFCFILNKLDSPLLSAAYLQMMDDLTENSKQESRKQTTSASNSCGRNSTSPTLPTTTNNVSFQLVWSEQHQPNTTHNNKQRQLPTRVVGTAPAQHYAQQQTTSASNSCDRNNTSPTLRTTTKNQLVCTSNTLGQKPTGPQGIQHQDGTLQSERETKKNLECRCQRDAEDTRHPPSRHSGLQLIFSLISPRHPLHKRTDKISKIRWNTYSGGSRISQKV